MTTTGFLPRLAPLALLSGLLLSGCTKTDDSSPSLSFIQLVPGTVSVPEEETRKLTVIATYSDGTVLPLTSGVSFSSSDPAKATVSGSGTVTGVLEGSSTIVATAGARTATCLVTVTPSPPRLVSVAVGPASPTIAVGGTQQLSVTATYNKGPTFDVTGASTFSTSDAGKATVSASGLVTGVAAGSATITAGYLGKTASTAVTVKVPVLLSIAVTPSAPTIVLLATQALKVTATYDIGPTLDVTGASTFTTSDAGKATVSAAGVVTGVGAGSATITASYGGKTATSAVTVSAAVLQSIAVAPAGATLVVGGTKQLVVTATYDVGPTVDVTGVSTFTTSDATRATVSSGGLVTAMAAGTATITAGFGGQIAASTITVSDISTTTGLVFTNDYYPGVSFSSFGGGALGGPTRDTTPADLNPNTASGATLRIDIAATGGFAGGTWFTSVPRDLRAFNALTFWAKASTANVLNVSGIGINATGGPFKAEALQFPLTGTWTKFVIPMPDPTKAVGYDGLFHFADGAKGYTVWLSDIQYESLPVAEVAAPTGATVGWPAVNVPIGGTFQIDPAPNTVSFATPVIPVGGSLKNVAFRWYTLTSADPTIATVDADGLVSGVNAGATSISATMNGLAVAGVAPVTVTAPLAVPTTIAATPTVPAANVISLFSSAYTGHGVDTWRTSWSAGNNELVDPYVIAGHDVKQYTLHNFVGIEFGVPGGTAAFMVDASTMTNFHVDLWSPDPPTNVEIQLVNNAGATISKFQTGLLATGSWVSLDIPLSGGGGFSPAANNSQLNQLLFVASGPTVLYVDNVYFHK